MKEPKESNGLPAYPPPSRPRQPLQDITNNPNRIQGKVFAPSATQSELYPLSRFTHSPESNSQRSSPIESVALEASELPGWLLDLDLEGLVTAAAEGAWEGLQAYLSTRHETVSYLVCFNATDP